VATGENAKRLTSFEFAHANDASALATFFDLARKSIRRQLIDLRTRQSSRFGFTQAFGWKKYQNIIIIIFIILKPVNNKKKTQTGNLPKRLSSLRQYHMLCILTQIEKSFVVFRLDRISGRCPQIGPITHRRIRQHCPTFSQGQSRTRLVSTKSLGQTNGKTISTRWNLTRMKGGIQGTVAGRVRYARLFWQLQLQRLPTWMQL
jgi:hypothetical protein